MANEEQKLSRLTAVLKMYYEQEMNQQQIAKIIGVSRPMVSKMLAEAKSLNMVTITINEVNTLQQMLSLRIEENFNVEKAIIIKTSKDTSKDMVQACYDIYTKSQLPIHEIGIGCGSMLGQLADIIENKDTVSTHQTGNVFPLIGGLKASYKSYHTNELVRVFSKYTGLTANYMYLPALVGSSEEKELYTHTELYSQIQQKWKHMNISLLNVSSIYAAPDLATSIRFGNRLKQQRSVGRYLAHYYDIDGNFIEPEHDNVMQIDIDNLKNSKYVIGLCSDKLDAMSVIGALRTDIFTHVLLTDTVARSVLKYIDENAQNAHL